MKNMNGLIKVIGKKMIIIEKLLADGLSIMNDMIQKIQGMGDVVYIVLAVIVVALIGMIILRRKKVARWVLLFATSSACIVVLGYVLMVR